MFYIKGVEKIKTQILCLITVFRKSCRFWHNVEKCGAATEATNDNTIRRMCVTCGRSKATRSYLYAAAHPHTRTHARAHTQKYVILIAFPRQQRFRRYVIRTPPLWLFLHNAEPLIRTVNMLYTQQHKGQLVGCNFLAMMQMSTVIQRRHEYPCPYPIHVADAAMSMT